MVCEGLAVAIVGRPNVGKSSLLNILLGRDRAIVSPHPGTTRDTIEEALEIQGLLVRVIDTAGMRLATDVLEQEGVHRARQAVERAELLLVVLDGSTALTAEDALVLDATGHKPRLLVRNKCDMPACWSIVDLQHLTPVSRLWDISALQGQGVQALEGAIVQQALGPEPLAQDEVLLTRARHRQGIAAALQNVRAAAQGLQQGLALEFVAFEVTEALQQIAEILGERCSADVLDRIFSSFCIGK
jgi:tRNA modification GTPase